MLNPTPSTRRLSTSTRPVPQAVHRDLNQKEASEGLFEFITLILHQFDKIRARIFLHEHLALIKSMCYKTLKNRMSAKA
jgi:hypothetical protein